jgi:hypothetical protein
MRRHLVAVVAFAVVITACGDDDVFDGGGTSATTTETSESTTETTAGAGGDTVPADQCTRDGGAGCVVLGLVLSEPAVLEEALAAARSFGGTPISVYRTDAVCVDKIEALPPGAPKEQVASRFAYVNAVEIRQRRMAASNAGLSPPITGMFIAESYWVRWEQEWSLAGEPGVLIEAVGLFTTTPAAEIAADPGIRAVEVIDFRWSDSVDPDYPGELFLEYYGFPGDHLSEITDPEC